MTSWLRDSPLRVSLGRRRAPPSPLTDVDPHAAFNSFIKHWQQTCDIFQRTALRGQIFADDVTAVINHLVQMVNLLMVDLKQIQIHATRTQNGAPRQGGCPPAGADAVSIQDQAGEGSIQPQHWSLPAAGPPHTPIFDHFVGEEILDRVLEWSLRAGEYSNVLKLEQLKVHEQLLSHSWREILVYKPIIRPLLKLLSSCGGCVHVEVEKQLVVLLNQLCVSLMNNQHLLDFFFQFSDQGPTKFVIFSVLLPYVHREGGVGQQARDALLHCMALSRSHTAVGQYIAQHSNFCPVLAAGLSGLYSTLPRTLPVEGDGWHRLTPDGISSIPQLQDFIYSLEFCNAVVQVAHPLVRTQLVEYLYQGFLVPVLGPALHQCVVEEAVAATAYVELCLRTVTEPQLLRVFLAFLMTSPTPASTPEPPLITLLISRLHSSNTQLCLVTLSLFWTLVELECEDVMVALVYQYLTPCGHVMLSQRSRLTQPPTTPRLVHLIPAPCLVEARPQRQGEGMDGWPAAVEGPQSSWQDHSPSSTLSSCSTDLGVTQAWTPYSEYLVEARWRVASAAASCASWAWRYDGLHPSPSQAVQLLEAARTTSPTLYPKPRAHSDPLPPPMLPGETKPRSHSDPARCPASGGLPNGVCSPSQPHPSTVGEGPPENRVGDGGGRLGEEENNLDSLGESSGYESFNIRISRDSSPATSTHGWPSGPLAQGGEDEDREFLEVLQRSRTPTEALEETLCELDQAFTNCRIYDLSKDKTYNNKVYGLAVAGEDWDSLPWESHESTPSEPVDKAPPADLHSRPTIGPFLEALLLRVDQMLSSSIHVNLLVTTVLSRLAAYPTPLLSSLLLDAAIVFQPSVRSLVQVIGGLKQRLESVLGQDDGPLLEEVRSWFLMRAMLPRPSYRSRTPSVSSTSTDTPLVRGEGKRRSLSQTMTALFRRTPEKPPIRENPLEDLPGKSGYRYIKRPSVSTVDGERESGVEGERVHAARVAVLLRDWLLELSALAQEHLVAVPTLSFSFPSS